MAKKLETKSSRMLSIFLLLSLLAFCVPCVSQSFELVCPTGTYNVTPVSPTYNTSTNKYRQWLCADYLGNTSLQGISTVNGFVPSAGSGTINPNNVGVNALALYPAAGASTTVSPGHAFYNSATGVMTLSDSGDGNGSLALSGNTSGVASITAPAVAGTATNPLLVTNSIQLPSGTVYNWNGDTGLSRVSAGVYGVGNGTAGNVTGGIQATNYGGPGANGVVTFGNATDTNGSSLNGSTLTIGSTSAATIASGNTNLILKSQAASNIQMFPGNALQWAFLSNANLSGGSSNVLVWTAGNALAAQDTGISRLGVASIGIGNGNQGNVTGALTSGTYNTGTNCSANGTAANPSIASCGSSAAGSFSCSTTASGGTCQVNTTAVTANSEIFVTQRADTTTGTRLAVTCNTTLSTVNTDIQTTIAGNSFTINLGTITTNPECFSYWIVN